MRIVANKALMDFASRHPLAGEPMQAWRKIIESRSFANFAVMKSTFNATDHVGDYYVFNIGGNKYRIIAAIHFNRQLLFIREVLTHKEYDAWKP
ncbi:MULTISPECIES: type II toxin-antitoxin system HigB family toxin [Janthinobacterium]|uniref:Type II toxin-antitoxin system HigB family toxin n=1 Tax=Janthinobacterium rivuli TaxID=2751478 RepID=A0ABY8I9G2_9BURK|nr:MULTISPECIES: type II toxin-antitoxin system HigB family toxin [Janthinobacterium]MBW3510925.1 type II toxin-antitoxin system HigB family toxin [Janthinobacterium sp. NKUCC06_STL]PHV32432.1 type II toxin-antitoxin system HigB family toxin [Janthinobacterium sp. BJB312]WFR81571.1 type II toxin-antitoxin system HigB family toxin [Janthinobacterium rivuli]